ncbi:Peptidoglycan-binding domain 1 protein [Crinalium epipsammum PCC 9333]|uniref:Peptidoglycan-binding domain 1 protein n=1 Tax=Crinalium epipsammum PCC 9333 TaxID=1173022 RepID=K9VT45_9CYAN|nr:peptidoglycan-binding domain-containing protein [Crinalium epipsammum]AFZ11243.1 Peptidoglycan-binding domain 1 protein [Crinalium epipsammum PCC 9333]
MNFKVVCLISGLTLAAAMPAYSSPNPFQIAQSDQSGGTMTRGDAMSSGNAMTPGDAMKAGDAMKSGNAMTPGSAMLKTGSTGEDVRFVQKFLRRKGFYTGSVNGMFDNETRTAVIKFQNSKKISPTGIVGPTTRSAMI